MNTGSIVVVLSLASALAFSVSSTLKHVSAGQVPDAQDLRPGSVARLVRASLTHRLWLLGLVADAVGLGLQVAALHLGALSVVQPLLISGLLFALLLRQRTQGRLRAAEIGWAVVLTASLAAFLVLAGTARQVVPTGGIDRGPAVAAGVVGAVMAVALVLLGRHTAHRGLAAALLGIAVGTVYATTAALIKAVTDVAQDGAVAVLTSWQLYTVVVLGAVGLTLNQLAFQAGPLSASLPAIATVDPLLSIAVGVLVYDEQIRSGIPEAIGLAALLLVLSASVIALTRASAEREDTVADTVVVDAGPP